MKEQLYHFGLISYLIAATGLGFFIAAAIFGRKSKKNRASNQTQDLNNRGDEFGTYAAHQPGYQHFKDDGMLDDYIYQALVHMQRASHELTWANTVLEDEQDVPSELKGRIKELTTNIRPMLDELRGYHKQYRNSQVANPSADNSLSEG